MWSRLNLSWALFFLVLGILNIVAVYYLSTKAWINFKFFVTSGLISIFIIEQAFYIARHALQNPKIDTC
nr:septation protein IspZ [Coxiella endosymbiont of Amblyomma nuttalli]